MPATYAHYLFGKKVYSKLSKELKMIIKEQKEAYWLGLHGPDLLFYYRPLFKNEVNGLGYTMHKEPAEKFFLRARKLYQDMPDEKLLAYLCGFICHFALDSRCHPYITPYMEEKRVTHSDIETDFDRSLMLREGHNPAVHSCIKHLRFERGTEAAISKALQVPVEKIRESILEFRVCIDVLQCKDLRKAKILKTVLGKLGKNQEMSGMVMTEIGNRKCEESSRYLRILMDQEVYVAKELMEEFVEMIDTKEPLNKRFSKNFE